MAASSGAIKAGKAWVEILTSDVGLRAGLARASARLRSWATTVRNIGAGAIGLGSAIVAPLAFAGASAAAYGDSLNDAATKTGLAVSEIAGLTYAAELNGASWETVAGAIKKMQVNLASGTKGGKQAIEMFDDLGLSVEALSALSPDEQFKIIADRIASLPTQMQRTAAAVKIFGRAGAELLPMLSGGAAGIAAMQKEADELGITLAADLASSVGDVDDLIGGLTMQFGALKTVIGVAIAEALRPVIKWAQPIIASWIRWIAANKDLAKTLFYIGAGLIVVGSALVAAGVTGAVLLAVLSLVATAGTGLVTALATGFTSIIAPIGLAVLAIGGVIGAFAYLSGFGGDVLGYLCELWGNLKGTAVGAWEGIVAAVGAGDLALAGQIAWAGLKLGFAEMVGFLESTWSSLQASIAKTAFSTMYGVMAWWEEGVDSIAQAWVTAFKFIGDVWAGFKAMLTAGWENTMDFFEDGWLSLIAATTGQDREALQKQADADRRGRNKENAENFAAGDAARQAQYEAEIAELKRQHEAAMAEIGTGANSSDKIFDDKNAATQEAIAAGLKSKQDELQKLIDQAKRERDDAANLWTLENSPQRPQRPDFDAMNGAKEAFESRGRFSGFGSFGQFNVSPVFGKLEDYASRTADAAETLVQQGEDDEGDTFG